MTIKRKATATALIGVVALTTGCSAFQKNSADGDEKNHVTVNITDDTCDVSTSSVASGTVRFTLNNKGTVRNEFEILATDKLRIIGERENLGPGTSVDYTVTLEPGNYFTACKKNMIGALVGTKAFTVTDSGNHATVDPGEQELRDEATANYLAYVRDQVGQLVAATEEFAAAYRAKNYEKARELYAPTRQYYERIEPTAEQFGDLDPALDERYYDYQEDNEKGDREWTGWHVLEADLWPNTETVEVDGVQTPRPPALTDEQREAQIDALVENTKKLYEEVYSPEFEITLSDISNGAIGLLEEVAISKITGEEEAFSHTDLWDFQANVEGAQVAFGNVEKLAKMKDPKLAEEIQTRLNEMNAELARYKSGNGYVSYDTLTETQKKDLSDKVNALRRPLAKLTEALLS